MQRFLSIPLAKQSTGNSIESTVCVQIWLGPYHRMALFNFTCQPKCVESENGKINCIVFKTDLLRILFNINHRCGCCNWQTAIRLQFLTVHDFRYYYLLHNLMANRKWKTCTRRHRQLEILGFISSSSSLLSFLGVVVNIWLTCMHNNWETRMCPCINCYHHRWLLLNVFERIFARNAMNTHLAANIDPNKRSTCEFQRNNSSFFLQMKCPNFQLTRMFLFELIDALNPLDWPRTSNCLRTQIFRFLYFAIESICDL